MSVTVTFYTDAEHAEMHGGEYVIRDDGSWLFEDGTIVNVHRKVYLNTYSGCSPPPEYPRELVLLKQEYHRKSLEEVSPVFEAIKAAMRADQGNFGAAIAYRPDEGAVKKFGLISNSEEDLKQLAYRHRYHSDCLAGLASELKALEDPGDSERRERLYSMQSQLQAAGTGQRGRIREIDLGNGFEDFQDNDYSDQ